MAKTESVFTGLAILSLSLVCAPAPVRAQSPAGPDPRAVGDPAAAGVAVTNAEGMLEWFTRPAGASGKTEDWIPAEGPPAPPQAYTWVTNQTDGSVTVITNDAAIQVTLPPIELRPRIRITPEGAVAEGGAFSLLIDGNLNHENAITIFPPGADPAANPGAAIQLHATAIAAYDVSSGKRLWLGQVQDTMGVVLDDALDGEPCRILWTNAMAGLKCDICLIYNKNSIIQDIYIREPIQLPEDAGLNPAATRLEIWSEWYAGPEPRPTSRTISLAAQVDGRDATPAPPEKLAADSRLDWSAMSMVAGKAFRVNSSPAGKERENWPVAKQWVKTTDNRSFIVESVDFEPLASALAGIKTASIPTPNARPPVGQSHPLSASTPVPSFSPPSSIASARRRIQPLVFSLTRSLARWDARQTAAWSQTPGTLIDWTLVNGLLFNVNFSTGGNKIGAAAVGKSTNDTWNMYFYPYSYDTTITNLVYSDNIASSASVRVQNAPGCWANSTGDAMYDPYSYSYSGNIIVTVQNLPTGIYDVLVYGHGGADNQNGGYTVSGTTKYTAVGPYWNNNQLASGCFTQDIHYVRFPNVSVTNGGTTVITASAGASGYTLINGIQFAAVENQAPTANPGSQQNLTYPAATTLQGTASDDGLPAGSILSLSWKKQNLASYVHVSPATGTGTAITSQASFDSPGVFFLGLIASDGEKATTNNVTVIVNSPGSGDSVWVDDALPSGATAQSDGGDSWSWIPNNPNPYSGVYSHQSAIAAGEHQHYFSGASPLAVQALDTLYCYVYLDPLNPPQQVMLQWRAADGTTWSHRAYWGPANSIGWPAVAMSASLPATDRWVRLEVPASVVDLGGRNIDGMAFTLFGGRAYWDRAGVSHPIDLSDLPPAVNAGPDQSVVLANVAALNGWALDDGRPAGSWLTYAWSQISGPGTVTFGNAASASTTAAFSAAGEYVLRLAVSDLQLSGYDEVTVTATTDADNDGLPDAPTLKVQITSPLDKATIP